MKINNEQLLYKYLLKIIAINWKALIVINKFNAIISADLWFVNKKKCSIKIFDYVLLSNLLTVIETVCRVTEEKFLSNFG